MKKKAATAMKAEYDFSKGGKGKYARRHSKQTNLVKIDPDLKRIFPDSRSVNDALRSIAKIVDSAKGRRRASKAT